MFEISVEAQFSAAHYLRAYKGKCENMHGHNWKVQVTCTSSELNTQGMVMDFSGLKKSLNKILMQLDHKVLNDVVYFKKANPTSENIAKFIYDKLNYKLLKVSVWETDTSCAAYYE